MRRTRSLLAVASAILLAAAGCSGGATEEKSAPLQPVVIAPVEVVRPAPPPAAVTANAALTIATNQYVYARLVTEDALAGKGPELRELINAWEDARFAVEGALEISSGSTQDSGTGAKSAPAPTPGQEFALNDVGAVEATPVRSTGTPLPAKDKSENWAESFTRYVDPAETTQILKTLAEDLERDISATLRGLQEIPAGKDPQFADVSYRVDLGVTSTEVPEKGTIRKLSSPKDRGADENYFVISGVDAIVLSGPRTSSIMVGAAQQVAVSEEDVTGAKPDVTALVGLVHLDPSASIDRAGNAENPAVFVGDRPGRWFGPQQITAANVEPEPNGEAKVQAAEVPRAANPDQTLENLRAVGVQPDPTPPVPLSTIAEEVRTNPREVATIIEILISVVGPTPQTTRPTAPDEPAAPPSSTGRMPANVVAGTYWVDQDINGEPFSYPAFVEIGQYGMLVRLNDWDPIVLQGDYDENSGIFVGREVDYTENELGEPSIFAYADTTIQFAMSGSNVTGYGDFAYGSDIFTMVFVKTGD